MKKLLLKLITSMLATVVGKDAAKKELEAIENEHKRLLGITINLQKSVASTQEKVKETCYHYGHTWMPIPAEKFNPAVPIKKRIFCSICGVQKHSWEQLVHVNQEQLDYMIEVRRKEVELKKYGPTKGPDKKPTT